MSINSRAEGAAGEREFSRVLQDHLGVRLARNLEQSRGGGHDLTVDVVCPVSRALDRFAFKVKRYASITPAMLVRFWNQALAQAHRAEKTPALAYRGNRQEWRVRIPLAAINETFPWHAFDYTVDMGVEAFAAVIRESIEAPT